MDLFLALSMCFIAGTQGTTDTNAVTGSRGNSMVYAPAAEVKALEDVLQKKNSLTNFTDLPAFTGNAIAFQISPPSPDRTDRNRPRRR